jgi:DNA repair protein RadC
MRLLAAVRTAPALADRLLGERTSLGAVLQLSDERLQQLGAGQDVVALFSIVREIVRAVTQGGPGARPRIEGGADVAALLYADMAWRETEEVRVAFLDSARRLIRIERFGEGSIDCAAIYPREIARRALELSAAFAILVHNHPSGDPTPSPSDRAMTRRLAAALATLDIRLIDHVIVARDGWASAARGISTVRISTGEPCANAGKAA